ncbi:glycohydrolase toxin TNT-related protein [Amycolatopsis sp. FDAARGOS 1241]|nr:glycohydrolase toxin TNT-related protein [Amycolatopsis sp. FDAARGOS 1241]QRP45281.1 glycohydrolase toxin TNT-related protein [Amycolatopsis sp. FDAARGOS 1241]
MRGAFARANSQNVHVAQPTTQLNATEQDTLVKQIGLALLRAAPRDWRKVTVEYRAVGRYHELTGDIRTEDGTAQDWVATHDIATLFGRLRAGMYRDGRGTWFNARYQLDHPSSYNLEYNREEPVWRLAPPPQAYQDELRMFPRTEENVPEWLIRRLSGLGPEQPGPHFRIARIFDTIGPAGRPVINRPDLDVAEQNRLLEYLDHAPVVVQDRGYDIDRLAQAPEATVPVAFHSDGQWIWPAAVNFYLRQYGVSPEPDLVEHIRANGFQLPQVDDLALQGAAAYLTRGSQQPPQQRPGPPPQQPPVQQQPAPPAPPAAAPPAPAPEPPAPVDVPLAVHTPPAEADEPTKPPFDQGFDGAAPHGEQPGEGGRPFEDEQYHDDEFDDRFADEDGYDDEQHAEFEPAHDQTSNGQGATPPAERTALYAPVDPSAAPPQQHEEQRTALYEPVDPTVAPPEEDAEQTALYAPVDAAGPAPTGQQPLEEEPVLFTHGDEQAARDEPAPPRGEQHAALYAPADRDEDTQTHFDSRRFDDGGQYEESGQYDEGGHFEGEQHFEDGQYEEAGQYEGRQFEDNEHYAAEDHRETGAPADREPDFDPGPPTTMITPDEGVPGLMPLPTESAIPARPPARPEPPQTPPPAPEPQQAPPARATQQPPQPPRRELPADPVLAKLQTRLDELEVPEAAYRLGTSTERGWTVEEVDEGWRVGWYDGELINPAVFGDADDAAAFMLGKVLLHPDGHEPAEEQPEPPAAPAPDPVADAPKPPVVATLSPEIATGSFPVRPRENVPPQEQTSFTPAEELFADDDEPPARQAPPAPPVPPTQVAPPVQPPRREPPVAPPTQVTPPVPPLGGPGLPGGPGALGGPGGPGAPGGPGLGGPGGPGGPGAPVAPPRREEPVRANGAPRTAAAANGSGNNQWPISPLSGEPPLTLFRGKEMRELPAGSELDRFGGPSGNLTYAAGTPFEERSLVPEWINRPYHVYRVQRPLETLAGVAIPWFNQPGGGSAYLLPASIEELLAEGDLIELEPGEPPID